MKTVFKIFAAVDCEGRNPYREAYYIALEEKHFVKPANYYRYELTPEGKQYVKKKLNIDWNGYYYLGTVDEDIKKFENLNNVINGKLQFYKI